MNVTTLIQQQCIKDFLRENTKFPRPAFPTLQAPSRSQNYRQVGQAFDYLLRFQLERTYGDRVRNGGPENWIASRGIAMLEPEEIPLHAAFEQAKNAYYRYIASGQVSDEIIHACLDLALLDKIVREGQAWPGMGIFTR